MSDDLKKITPDKIEEWIEENNLEANKGLLKAVRSGVVLTSEQIYKLLQHENGSSFRVVEAAIDRKHFIPQLNDVDLWIDLNNDFSYRAISAAFKAGYEPNYGQISILFDGETNRALWALGSAYRSERIKPTSEEIDDLWVRKDAASDWAVGQAFKGGDVIVRVKGKKGLENRRGYLHSFPNGEGVLEARMLAQFLNRGPSEPLSLV